MQSLFTWWKKAVIRSWESQTVMMDLSLECYRILHRKITGQVPDGDEPFSTQIEFRTLWGPIRIGYDRQTEEPRIKDIN